MAESPELRRMRADSMVRDRGLSLEEALRRIDLQDRVPRLDRLLGERYAGAEYAESDGSYHLWITGSLDAEIVEVVSDRMREASMAADEWAIHTAPLSRAELRAGADVLAERVRSAAWEAIHSIGSDFRRGVLVVEVLRGTSLSTMRAIRSGLPPTPMPVEVVEGEFDTHARAGAVDVASFGAGGGESVDRLGL